MRAGRIATAERVRASGVGVLAEEMLPRLLSPENFADKSFAGTVREMILRQPAEGMIASLSDARSRGQHGDL